MNFKDFHLNKRMVHYKVPGVSIAIIDKGEIASAEGFGLLEAGTDRLVTKDSIFHACSISKFVAAMLTLKLVDEGLLDLDEDVNERLQSWKVPDSVWTRSEKVTLRRLLSHQSGLTDPKESFGLYDPIAGAPKMADLLNGITPYCSIPIKVSYDPGSEFQYSDAGYCVIQQLIEDVTGVSYEQLLKEKLLDPLKMNHTISLTTTKSKFDCFACGHNQSGEKTEGKYTIYPYPAASGLWSNPTDLAKLSLELFRSLTGFGQLGYSRSLIWGMVTSQGCSEWTGLGVFLDHSLEEVEISSLGWGVGFQSMLVAYPHFGKGAIIMTNSDLGVHQMKGLIGEIFRSLDFLH